MSGTAIITEGKLLRKRRDKQVTQEKETVIVNAGTGFSVPAGQLLLALNDILEVIDPGTAGAWLNVKLPIGCDGEVQAFTDSGNMPANIWEGMPIASATVLGGVKVGSGLSITDGVLSASATAYTFQYSLVNNTGTVNLVGDTAAPGNSKMYGTNGAGTRGWYDVPSSMVYPGSGIALSTGSSWGASIANNSGNWNTAYGWGNHAGLYTAIAHSTNYSNPHSVTATQVGLGNVTNESKATMFSSPTFTGTVTMPGSGAWNSSGNVGVGIASPETKFHSVQSANAQGFFHASTANTGFAASAIYAAYYGHAIGVNTTSASYYALLINAGVSLTTGGWTGGTTRFIVWADGATFRGTIGSSAAYNQRYFQSETAVGATSGDKILYLFNNGSTIKLDAYDYGTSSAINFELGGNGGSIYAKTGVFGIASIGATDANFVYTTNGVGRFDAYAQHSDNSYRIWSYQRTGGAADILTLGRDGNLAIVGNITATGEVTAYYSSDRFLKQNIHQFSALDKIDRMNPVAFTWNSKARELNNAKDDRVNYGMIAQELEQVMPELVHGIYDNKYKSVDYVQGVPIAFQGIKELYAMIKELRGEINTLRNAVK